MTDASLVIQFTGKTDRDRSVKLEHFEFFPYLPPQLPVTRARLFFWLQGKLFDESDMPRMTAGGGKRWILAYPNPPDLPYRLGMSYGSHGEQILMSTGVWYSETILCSMDPEIIPKQYVVEIYSWRWIGQAYDSKGVPIDPAPFTRLSEDGKRLFVDIKVYGLIAVSYRYIYHAYLMALPDPPRQEDPDEQYVSYAYAAWEGGNTYLGLGPDKPLDVGGGFGDTDIEDDDEDDDDDDEYIKGEDEIHEFDYCTGEELTDD